ncbi:TRAP transporter small permease [Falsiroseomonas sp. E2-1-a20]|uniref:TRAP transporter small permease n=1 Tax=Falsiroseomonas sp. E2-1-a20 TaxID=3239300 RepID=UPI003F30A509
MPPPGARGIFRRITEIYAKILDVLLVVTVVGIILPVTMQIFARFVDFIPRYIWTEELARLLLVWMIMIGSMIGVREATHFNVDLFNNLRGRTKAAMDILSALFVLGFAYVFIVYGWEFTDTAWFRISELAELPLWIIHIAWPIAGVSWVIFAGERIWDDLQILLHGEKAES